MICCILLVLGFLNINCRTFSAVEYEHGSIVPDRVLISSFVDG